MTNQENDPQHEVLQKKHVLEEHEVKEVVGFLKRHGKLIGTGALAAIVTVLASNFYAHHKAANLAKAEQILMTAQTPEQLEELISKYSSTPAAPVAMLDLAKTLYNGGDYVQARAQYDRFLKKFKNHDMRPVAELGLAYCTEADGNFAGAAAQFSEFSKKYSKNYLCPLAVLGTARCQEQAGNVSEARITLEDFLAANATSPWAATADSALKQINETAQKK